MGGKRDFLISSSYLGDFDIKKCTIHTGLYFFQCLHERSFLFLLVDASSR